MLYVITNEFTGTIIWLLRVTALAPVIHVNVHLLIKYIQIYSQGHQNFGYNRKKMNIQIRKKFLKLKSKFKICETLFLTLKHAK